MFEITPIREGGYDVYEDERSYLMPQGPSFRSVVLGKTGSGKTEVVSNMLCKGWLPTKKVFICAKVLDQPVYDAIVVHFMKALEDANKEIRKYNKKTENDEELEELEELALSDLIEFHDDPKQLPDPNDLDREKMPIFVFDDFLTEQKDHPIIEKFFTRGRPKNVSSIFLAQSLIEIPKLIRSNCDYFFIFGGIDDRALVEVKNMCGQGLDNSQFRKAYHYATRKTEDNLFPFMMVDKKTTNDALRFRRGFDELILRI